MSHGLVVCDDLIFASRVIATARAHGLTVTQARTPAAAIAKATASPFAALILDLHLDGLDVPKFLADLRAACPAMPRVIGYGSHVDAARLKAAREAGCDLVLPRSAFVERLEAELPAWFAVK